jgi:ribosome-associated protein
LCKYFKPVLLLINEKILVNTIIEGIREKKGKEIILIDFSGLQYSICDFFIICHGDSNTQVSAIAESVDEKVKISLNQNVSHFEGIQNAQWVLMDYQNVIVHIFQKQYRDYYKLEELWGDARISLINEE